MTNATRFAATAALAPAARAQSAAGLRALATAYYAWRDSLNPVATSDAGAHRWDDRLGDFRMAAIQANRLQSRRCSTGSRPCRPPAGPRTTGATAVRMVLR